MNKRLTIGTTNIIDFPNAITKFRMSTIDESGREVDFIFDIEDEATKEFEDNKIELGDVYLFVVFIDSNDIVIDEELINSYWDEETGN